MNSLSELLPHATAQALWAAMYDDDDLVEDYVNLCVIHGLLHLVKDTTGDLYRPESWGRIHEYLEIARRQARETEDPMIRRFYTHTEPPF